MKLTQKLPITQFVLSMASILISGLLFLAGLYYILNIQYQKPQGLLVNGPVTTLPKSLRLDLDQPDDNSLTFTPSIIISGQTAPKVIVLISTDTKDKVIGSETNGSFSTVLELNEGVNKITAAIFDSTGDSRSVTRTVYYSKEKI